MGTCIKIPYCMYPRMNIQIVFYRRILRFNFLGAVNTPYPHWNFRPTVRRPSDPVSDASGKTMILAPLPWATRSVCLNGSAPNFDGWFPSDCWPFSWRLTLPSTKWLMLWFLWLFVCLYECFGLDLPLSLSIFIVSLVLFCGWWISDYVAQLVNLDLVLCRSTCVVGWL